MIIPAATPAAAPPPPSAEAPAPAAAPPPPAPGAFTIVPGTELDSEGLPWDERIHSGNKTKNKDGSWKARKNTPEATVTAVVAELRQHYPATAPAAPAAAPPPPPPGEAPAPAAAPPPPAASGAPTFVDLMNKLTPNLAAGKITQANVVDAVKNVGLSNPAELGKPENAQHIPAVIAYIDALLVMAG
jgi:hypothetical protein